MIPRRLAERLAAATRVALVANGPGPGVAFLSRHLAKADAVLACDGAARQFAGHGLPLHAVVGDLDSITEVELKGLGSEVDLVRDPDQNTFDLEKALALVLGACPETVSVRLFGAWGGRIDHSLANLMLLSRYPGRDLHLIDPGQEFFFAVPGPGWGRAKNGMDLQPGTPVSLLPFGKVLAVESRGLRWPLDGRDLEPDGLLGNSNEAVEPFCEVRYSAGLLGLSVLREPDCWV